MNLRGRRFLNRKEAAHYLSERGCQISGKTLRNLASHDNSGKGPSYYKVRWNRVGYLTEDLDAWLKKEMVRVE